MRDPRPQRDPEPQYNTEPDSTQSACRLFDLPPELRTQIYQYCYTLPANNHEVPLGSKPKIPNELRRTCHRIKDDSEDVFRAAIPNARLQSTFTISLDRMRIPSLDHILEKIKPDIDLHKRIIFETHDKYYTLKLRENDTKEPDKEKVTVVSHNRRYFSYTVRTVEHAGSNYD
jgi:hypothetical protein